MYIVQKGNIVAIIQPLRENQLGPSPKLEYKIFRIIFILIQFPFKSLLKNILVFKNTSLAVKLSKDGKSGTYARH